MHHIIDAKSSLANKQENQHTVLNAFFFKMYCLFWAVVLQYNILGLYSASGTMPRIVDLTEVFHPTSKHRQADRILTETHVNWGAYLESKRLWIDTRKITSELQHCGSDGKLLECSTPRSMHRIPHTVTDTQTSLITSGRNSALIFWEHTESHSSSPISQP